MCSVETANYPLLTSSGLPGGHETEMETASQHEVTSQPVDILTRERFIKLHK